MNESKAIQMIAIMECWKITSEQTGDNMKITMNEKPKETKKNEKNIFKNSRISYPEQNPKRRKIFAKTETELWS